MSPSQPIRCVIYTRVSVADFGADPDLSSCALQYAACAKYIEQKQDEGWQLVDERFDDDGASGANTDRPALDRLLTRALAGQIDCVVVFRVDRLTRSMRDWAYLSRGFAQRNIILHMVRDDMRWGGSAISRFQLDLLASFAELERDMIIERTRDAHAARRARGERSAGAVPFGYEADSRSKQLIPHAQRRSAVVWMFELAQEGVPPSEIATRGNRRRIRTATGGKWTPRTVLKLLRNPVYMGLRAPDVVGVHEPLVAPQVFESVQLLLNARQSRAPSPRVRNAATSWDPFILRGLVRCTRCLKPMTTSTSGPRWRRTRGRPIRNDARYYRCRRQGCAGSQVSADLIESKVRELFLLPPDNVDEHLIEFIEIGVRFWDVLITPNRARLCRSIFDAILWDGRTGKVKPIWAGPDEDDHDE